MRWLFGGSGECERGRFLARAWADRGPAMALAGWKPAKDWAGWAPAVAHCAVVFGLACSAALAADPPGKTSLKAPYRADAAASPGAGDSTPGAKMAAFDRQFAEWKALLAELRKAQQQYQVAARSERPALEKKFESLLDEGRAMEPKLVKAAEQAYDENPQAPQLGEFLTSVVVDASRRDDYEEAYRLGKSLVGGGVKSSALDGAFGIAAFCENQYDEARKYLKLADIEKTLSDEGKGLLAKVDECAALWAKEAEIRAAEAKADDLPRVKITTTKGDIVVELFENEAPNTTANFISLVEKGYYNGTPFHRVLPHFMAQGGDPTGTGRGGPDYHITCECYRPDYRRHFRGSLSMAHAGRDTGGSQFFLTFVPTLSLNGKHTAFGRVVEGLDVLAKIERIDPDSKSPAAAPPDKIEKAVVVRKRNHEYAPVKTVGRHG